jgi:hypothetical protein
MTKYYSLYARGWREFSRRRRASPAFRFPDVKMRWAGEREAAQGIGEEIFGSVVTLRSERRCGFARLFT